MQRRIRSANPPPPPTFMSSSVSRHDSSSNTRPASRNASSVIAPRSPNGSTSWWTSTLPNSRPLPARRPVSTRGGTAGRPAPRPLSPTPEGYSRALSVGVPPIPDAGDPRGDHGPFADHQVAAKDAVQPGVAVVPAPHLRSRLEQEPLMGVVLHVASVVHQRDPAGDVGLRSARHRSRSRRAKAREGW